MASLQFDASNMIGRLLEDAASTTTIDEFSKPAQMSLSIIQRISGFLSLLGGLYVTVRAFKRWNYFGYAFDRIMLLMGLHTVCWGIWHIWGTAAMPVGTEGVVGAMGNTETCTAQGFLIQLSFAIPFYYVFLSLYSWAVIMRANFDATKYEWIERYIHVGVHIFPIFSAIYLLEIDAFNANGLFCYIGSLPPGCGDDSGITCTRGPQNPGLVLWIFGGMPALFVLIFPTVVMATLTFGVWYRQKEGIIASVITVKDVAFQSAVYLGALYWVYLPVFVYQGLQYTKHSANYVVSLWVTLISYSMGLWFAIVYWCFSDDSYGPDAAKVTTPQRENTAATTPSSSNDEASNSGIMKMGDKSPQNEVNVRGSLTIEALSKGPRKKNRLSSNSRFGSSSSSSNDYSKRRSSVSQKRASKRFSFNIFDGTASAGMFADFVFEGDSEDEEKDQKESSLWEDCQEINSTFMRVTDKVIDE